MRYSGSKNRLSKYILPYIEERLKNNPNMYYVEPFMGGCNILDKVNHPYKIGSDSNPYIVALWRFLQSGGQLPTNVDKTLYTAIKTHPEKYPDWLIGYVGSACSYGGAWFAGYANFNEKRKENHIKEAYNGIQKQLSKFRFLEETSFQCTSYDELQIPEKSLIYCDPPYNGTRGYKDSFDSIRFWDWVRKMRNDGHILIISEYNAPDDFQCIWQMEKKDGMKTTIQGGKQPTRIEKLFL